MLLVNFVKKYGFYLIWTIFFLFLLFQHRSVFMHFDDFGYATLPYYTNGMKNWNLNDLLWFLNRHYFHWGGRVIPFFILSMALSCGELFIKIFQSCLLFTIMILAYLIVKNKSNDVFAVLLIIISYCMLNLSIVREGIFWYTASAVYVWPLFFLFGGLLLLREFPRQPKYVIPMVIAFFLAACSHEQIAVLTIMTIIVFTFLKYRETHMADKTNILILVTVIIGGAIEILAPGNFARAASPENVAFYQLTFVEKICNNVPAILHIIFDSKLEAAVLAVMMFLAGIKIFRFNENHSKFLILLTLNVFATLIMIFSIGGGFTSITWEQQAVGLFIFTVVFWAEITFYLIKQKNYILTGLFQGAFCSQIMMIMAPDIASRSLTPFMVIINFIFAYIFIQSIGARKFFNMAIYLLAGVIAIFSFNNVFEITKGYAENNFVNSLNRFKITEYAAKIASGQKVKAIVLYRLPDDRYSFCMPYQREVGAAALPWIKTYFEIPQKIPIVWNKFGASNDIYETINTEYQLPKIESISIGEMNLKTGLMLLIKYQGTIPVSIFVNGKKLPYEIQGDILSVIVPRSELNVILEVKIKKPLTKLTYESIKVQLDKNFVNQYKLNRGSL